MQLVENQNNENRLCVCKIRRQGDQDPCRLIQDLLHQPIRSHWSSSSDRNRLTRIRYNWRRPSPICSFLTSIILCHFKSKCLTIITKGLLNIKLSEMLIIKSEMPNFLNEKWPIQSFLDCKWSLSINLLRLIILSYLRICHCFLRYKRNTIKLA